MFVGKYMNINLSKNRSYNLCVWLDNTQGVAGEKYLEDVVPFILSGSLYKKFGWGNPLWIGWVSLPFKNVVIFIDTNSGDGIEAWVH